MSGPAQKCENNAISKQNFTLKLFIAFKMPHFCCFTLGENQDGLDFLQKSFITSTADQKSWANFDQIFLFFPQILGLFFKF